jgi:alpha-L-glutamate ligase-like protein
MPVSTSLLGMNARNFQYIRKYNRRSQKLVADDKLLTKKRLLKHQVPTMPFLAHFKRLEEVRHYDWESLPSDFVIKPAHGYGGRGITIVHQWDGERGQISGQTVDVVELERIIFGALDGEHSLNNLPDTVFIEDCIRTHSFFKKYTSKGVPDIRVIVCNMVPVMAMLRLPTIHSDGKANLHLGALGIGIDMRTGITTAGTLHNRTVQFIPGTKTKVHGIRLPDWDHILEVAVAAQRASKLGFAGVDIVLDDQYGAVSLRNQCSTRFEYSDC